MQRESKKAWIAVASLVGLMFIEAFVFQLGLPRREAFPRSTPMAFADTLSCIEDSIPVAVNLPNPDSLWVAIDAHALAAPDSVEHDAASLARYLCAPAKNDFEKVRAIFRWIADRIRYDYANLFNLLTAQVGIQSVKVIGFSKGFGSLRTRNSLEADHAWNAFLIDSTWHLIDVTWAASYGQLAQGQLHSTQRFNPYWFDTPPEEFVFMHLPEQGRWQLLPQTLSVADFECLPQVSSDFFKLGFSAPELLAQVATGMQQSLVRVFSHPYKVQAEAAPMPRYLDLGDSLQLRFVCANCASMTAQTAGKFIEFERQDSLFCLDIHPKKGTLRVFGRKRRYAPQYNGIMEWIVRKPKGLD
jgi:hypothetical protein